MTTSADHVAKVIHLNGGKIVGKTRFQKTVYFLEEFGGGFGFDFDYHHYGPYSEELSLLMNDAEALNLCSVQWDATTSGTRYAVFNSDKEDFLNESQDNRRKAILETLNDYDSVTLELAATADFLRKFELQENEWEETARRKPKKASQERIEKAKRLLNSLK